MSYRKLITTLRTKAQEVRDALAAGEDDKALKICKKFHQGFSVDDKRAIDIAVETANGHGQMYKALNIDVDKARVEALAAVKKKFGPK